MPSLDFSKTTSGSSADPHRHIGLAIVMDMLAEQHESNLDEPTAERVNCTIYQWVSCNMQPKLNILAAFFVIKARGEGYTGHTSACGLLMLLTTAFTA